MIQKPHRPPAHVNDIRVLPARGPWTTKSNGNLNVLFSLDSTVLNEKYFHYEKSEIKKTSRDIRGLRSYTVGGLNKDAIGAHEWHRIRNELVFVVKGSVNWVCEDVYGQQQEYIIDQNTGVWTPPFILHTYEVLQDDTEIIVLANTLFFPEDSNTHDTFTATDFKNLQVQYI